MSFSLLTCQYGNRSESPMKDGFGLPVANGRGWKCTLYIYQVLKRPLYCRTSFHIHWWHEHWINISRSVIRPNLALLLTHSTLNKIAIMRPGPVDSKLKYKLWKAHISSPEFVIAELSRMHYGFISHLRKGNSLMYFFVLRGILMVIIEE